MATKYECDRCGKMVNDIKQIRQLRLLEKEGQMNTCWDFQISHKDICENCGRELGEFLKKQQEIKLV